MHHDLAPRAAAIKMKLADVGIGCARRLFFCVGSERHLRTPQLALLPLTHYGASEVAS